MSDSSEHDDDNGKGLIDRAYDGLDRFVTTAGHLLGVDVNAPDPGAGGGTPAHRVGVDRQVETAGAATSATKQLPPPSAPTPATTVAPTERAFEIVEVLGRGGHPISWIVTNGIERAECASAQLANAVLLHLRLKLGAKGGAA